MANQTVIFGLLGAGALALVAGVTGSSLGDVIAGKPNKVSHTSTVDALLNNGVAGVGSVLGTAASSSGSSAKVTGSVTSAMLAKIGAEHGWSGSQIDDWMEVIEKESGGNPNATNSSTQAYGIGQFLDPTGGGLAANKQKYYQYGGNPNTVIGQLEGMANYIEDTYGTPSAALASENTRGWY